jgi:hypothetical protein
MATSVLFTIDVELLWSADVARGGWKAALARSYDPAGVGIPYQLARLAEHNLRAVFFVDPMPALHFGLEPIKRMVVPILDAGQSVELHLHPQWSGLVDGQPTGSFELNAYSEAEQRALMAQACELLVTAGAPVPTAFRAGSYAADDRTLRAAASLGLRYDLSHNGSAHPWPSGISLPPAQIAPIAHEGIVEIPVSLIGDRSGYRHLQICAVSLTEMQAALRHANVARHPVVTIVSHSFELATRNGLSANRTHVNRFIGLCEYLDEHRAQMPSLWFRDLDLPDLGVAAEALPSNALRTLGRQAQQLWSNIYEERGPWWRLGLLPGGTFAQTALEMAAPTGFL